MTFNWFDIVLAFILVVSATTGLRAGFARVVVGIMATIFGLLAGFWCYRLVADKLSPWVKTPALADLIGFLVIFMGILILGSLISALLSKLFRWVGLSWFNHLLGGLAGFCRGVLVVAALADVLIAFAPSPTPAFIQESRMLPYATEMSLWLANLAPRELKDSFDQQMDNLRRFWKANPSKPTQGQQV